MHYHLTIWQSLVGGFVLILVIVFAIAGILRNRMAKTPPFLNYFGSKYDRDLLQHSSMSESEDWRSDRQPRFTPFRLRDSAKVERD